MKLSQVLNNDGDDDNTVNGLNPGVSVVRIV